MPQCVPKNLNKQNRKDISILRCPACPSFHIRGRLLSPHVFHAQGFTLGHFTHETESPWPLRSKRSRWWRRRSRSKFTSLYAWGTNGVSVNARWMRSLRGFLHGIKWIVFDDHLDYIEKPPLEGRCNTKPGDHSTSKSHNRWFLLISHVWGPVWIQSIEIAIGWGPRHIRLHAPLKAPWPTLHDVGGVVRRPLVSLFWALTISWSRLVCKVAHRSHFRLIIYCPKSKPTIRWVEKPLCEFQLSLPLLWLRELRNMANACLGFSTIIGTTCFVRRAYRPEFVDIWCQLQSSGDVSNGDDYVLAAMTSSFTQRGFVPPSLLPQVSLRREP